MHHLWPVEYRYRALIQAGEVVVYRPGTETTAGGTVDPSLGRCLGEGKWRGMKRYDQKRIEYYLTVEQA